MFKNLNYRNWCEENEIHKLFNIDLEVYGKVENKQNKTIYESVDPNNAIPYPPELDDLIRIHYLVRSRRVTTVLEFGVGKSTTVIAHALNKNKSDYDDFVKNNLRRANPFEVHSVDVSEDWIETCKKDIPKPLESYTNFYVSEVEMTTFNGRACTMYKKIPNICPDFIYLDAPDQFCVKNDIRGISTASLDRLPMSADILLMEPFLLPRTLILVDGRTSNARFLKNNLQRNWKHEHLVKEDIHLFELMEDPLGKLNALQIDFCLNN